MPVGKNFTIAQLPDDYSVEIGRNDSELNIPDISVNKIHGYLKYDTSIDEVIYTDNNSKYGSQQLI